jgi:hypothetical protein
VDTQALSSPDHSHRIRSPKGQLLIDGCGRDDADAARSATASSKRLSRERDPRPRPAQGLAGLYLWSLRRSRASTVVYLPLWFTSARTTT